MFEISRYINELTLFVDRGSLIYTRYVRVLCTIELLGR